MHLLNYIGSKINSIDVSHVTEEYSCSQASARVHVLERHASAHLKTIERVRPQMQVLMFKYMSKASNLTRESYQNSCQIFRILLYVINKFVQYICTEMVDILA